jgi:predicted transcriptional regulator
MHEIAVLGADPVTSFAQPDRALLKAVVQAHAWLALLMNGAVQSIEELARHVGRDRPYVRRVLKLAFLKPSMTENIFEARQPTFASATELLAADFPIRWLRQAAHFQE